MAEEVPLSWIREIGGVFRLGSGVLGKSAIGMGIFVAVGGIAIFRLHSDAAILTALTLIALGFFVWFFPVLRFCKDHPDTALLDGAEWTGYQRDQVAAKGYRPIEGEARIKHVTDGREEPINQIDAGQE